ncbi:MAG TPA: hypothetical protein VHP83_04025 [Aggregatilineaceae bacterium]|nr:hypothetical protein [Aggregatilineaceae bacterium]
MIKHGFLVAAVLFLVLGHVPFSAAHARQDQPPFIYYYSTQLNSFVIERTDGTDSTLLGQGLVTEPVLYGAEWSGAGHWLLWRGGGAPYTDPAIYGAVRYDGSRTLESLKQLVGITAAWSPNNDDRLMVLAPYRLPEGETHAEFYPAVYIIDAEQDRIVQETPLDEAYVVAQWSSDGRYIVLLDHMLDDLLVVVPTDGSSILTRPAEYVTDRYFYGPRLSWTPDGRAIYRRPGTDRMVIEEFSTGESLEFPFTTGETRRIEWNGDQALLFVSDEDSTQLWRLSLSDPSLTMITDDTVYPGLEADLNPVYAPNFSSQIWTPDGARALVPKTDGKLYWYHAADGTLTEAGIPPMDAEAFPLMRVQWSDPYAFVLWGNDAYLMDLASDQVVQSFEAVSAAEGFLRFDYTLSPDGRSLAHLGTCDGSRSVGYCIWDWAAGTTVYLDPNPLMENPGLPYPRAFWLPNTDVLVLAENGETVYGYDDFFWSIALPDGSLYRQLTEHSLVPPQLLPANVDTSQISPTEESVSGR